MPRTRWLGVAISGVAATGFIWGCRSIGFRINTSPSAAPGLWLITDDHVPPVHGTYVALCLLDEWAAWAAGRHYIAADGECPRHREVLLKQVIAIPGDTVVVSDAGIAVDGRPIPSSKPLAADDEKRPLHGIDLGTYEVVPGQIWVIGPGDPRSFDSRYFGPVAEESIYRTARPWLTF